LIIGNWENRHLDWAAIMSTALVREATANRKNRVTALAYWLGMFYTPLSGKERPSSRQKEMAAQPPQQEDEAGRNQGPAKRQAPAVAQSEEAPPTEEEEKEKKKKKKKKPPVGEFELWEIGPSGVIPDSPPEEEPVRPKKRRLRRPASREDGATTIAVDRFPAQGPPTRTTVRIVPTEGRAQPRATSPPPPAEVVIMRKDLPTMAAAAEADVPAEEETLPVAEERPAQEPTAEPAAAQNDIQVPTWNLGEHIPIAP
jgi:hypothetical protein